MKYGEIEFPVQVQCTRCKKMVAGKVIWSINSFDTPGFFAFDDGVICDGCMDKQ